MSSHDWNGKRRWSYFCAKKVFFKGFACGFLAGVPGAIEDSQQGGVNALFALLLLGTLFSSKYSGLEICKFPKGHVGWDWSLLPYQTSLLLEVSCNTTVVFLFLSSLKKLEIGAKMASSPLSQDRGDNWTPWGRETQNSISILHRYSSYRVQRHRLLSQNVWQAENWCT